MTTPDRSTLVRRIVVEGAVQGVGYREFTRRAALRLNVSGWVRNRSDGAVEALVRGSPAGVEALIAEMRQGPRFAVVERLERDRARRSRKATTAGRSSSARPRSVGPSISRVAPACPSPRASPAAVAGRRPRSASCWRADRSPETILRSPRRVSPRRRAPRARRLLRLVFHVGRSVGDMRRDAAGRSRASPYKPDGEPMRGGSHPGVQTRIGRRQMPFSPREGRLSPN